MNLGYSVFTPLGLASLHAATPEGYDVRVLDMTQHRWNDLCAESFTPYDIIGISIRYTYDEKRVKSFLKQLSHRFPEKVLIVGGQHATYDVDGMLNCGVDYVVQFVGEKTWEELLLAIREGRDPAGMAGLACRRDGVTRIGPNRPFLDPNLLPIPSFHVFRSEDYPLVREFHAASAEASRGCPNRCRFCTNPAIWQGQWKAKTVPRVLEELDRVERAGFNFVYFADDNFGVDVPSLVDLLEAMAGRKRVMPFMALMQPATIAHHPDVLDLAWKAGMRVVSLDTNTIDEETRAQYNREDGYDTIRRALQAVSSSPVAALSNVIVGAPGEGKDVIRRNIRFSKRNADIFSCGTLEPRPGNRFWKESDWERTEMLGKGEPLLHEKPIMVRRMIHLALLSYYFHPFHILRALFSPKIGTRIIFRLHYRLYTNAALNKFFGRNIQAQPSLLPDGDPR